MQEYKLNYDIKAQSVLLIDQNGVKLGILPFRAAMAKANEAELDLVCINESPQCVCKIMNYSKFKYEQTKREKENKAKQKALEQKEKEIQMSINIAAHDLEVKLKKAREEILDKNRIRAVVCFKGRELSHPELGFELMGKFISGLSDCSSIYKESKLEGRYITCVLAPIKEKK